MADRRSIEGGVVAGSMALTMISPTAHTLFDADPEIALYSPYPSWWKGDQTCPLNRVIPPPLPTAQTSADVEPHSTKL